MIRIIVVGRALGFFAAGTIAAPGDDLHRLFDQYWDHEMEINPFVATTSGINLYNERVPDISRAAQKQVLDKRLGSQDRLEAISLLTVSTDRRLYRA